MLVAVDNFILVYLKLLTNVIACDSYQNFDFIDLSHYSKFNHEPTSESINIICMATFILQSICSIQSIYSQPWKQGMIIEHIRWTLTGWSVICQVCGIKNWK